MKKRNTRKKRDKQNASENLTYTVTASTGQRCSQCGQVLPIKVEWKRINAKRILEELSA